MRRPLDFPNLGAYLAFLNTPPQPGCRRLPRTTTRSDIVDVVIGASDASLVRPTKTQRIYRVTTADGAAYDLPGQVWRPDPPDDVRGPYKAMTKGVTHTADTLDWWDELCNALEQHVPGNKEIVTVEIL